MSEITLEAEKVSLKDKTYWLCGPSLYGSLDDIANGNLAEAIVTEGGVWRFGSQIGNESEIVRTGEIGEAKISDAVQEKVMSTVVAMDTLSVLEVLLGKLWE